MATQAERREHTRARVLAAARDLFGTQGYAATSIGDIIDRAAVSRGALYHHFDSKDDVFAAVFVATSADVIRRSVAAGSVGRSSASPDSPADSPAESPTGSPLDSLVDACLAWLDEVRKPDVSQILLIDGPAVLGWERARTLEEATSLGVVRRGLAAAQAAGEIDVASIDLAARLVNSVVAEAALDLQGQQHRAGRGRSVGDGVDHDASALVGAMIRGLADRSV